MDWLVQGVHGELVPTLIVPPKLFTSAMDCAKYAVELADLLPLANSGYKFPMGRTTIKPFHPATRLPSEVSMSKW